jgi:putative redox protein
MIPARVGIRADRWSSAIACGLARMPARPTARMLSVMSMTATARCLEGGLRSEVDVNGRHRLVTDEPVPLGGTDLGPAPHELLAAMVASCVATMIAMYAQARDWQLGEVRVEAVYESDSTPRHVDLQIYLPDGLSSDQLRRLRRVAETCPAKRALEGEFTVEERFVLDEAATLPV